MIKSKKKKKLFFDLEEIINESTEGIISLIPSYKVFVIGFSGGKDSSVLLNQTIFALKEAKNRGIEIPLLVVHSNNTMVENPEVISHVINEFVKVKSKCDELEIEVQLSWAYPSLVDHWVTSILTGRKLPSYPDKSTSDCTVDYKVKPGAKAIKTLVKEHDLLFSDVIILLGTRFDESTSRKANMDKRGESHQSIAKCSKNGDTFAPIATWTTTDIWSYLTLAQSKDRHFSNDKLFEGYSDFSETFRIYADATDGEGCFMLPVGENALAKKSKGCGARHGCWSCTRVNDNRSLRAMIDNDERYTYMRPLLNIQNFLVKNQYDLNGRNPILRSISPEGFIGISPDTLHPKTLEKLLIACLTVDRDSEAEAARLGLDKPKIEPILSLDRLAYIDAIWSLRGFFPAYHAWHLACDVYNYKKEHYFPDIVVGFSKTKIPPKRFLDAREHYTPFEEYPWKEAFWKTTYSVRDETCFLEDGDFYDEHDNDIPDEFYSEEINYPKSLTQHHDFKLEKQIRLNLTNLNGFLEENAGINFASGILKLSCIEKSNSGYKSQDGFGRTSGFTSYLNYGILKYSKGQKKWIQNAFMLTHARFKALGEFDIPTYEELINRTVAKTPDTAKVIINTNNQSGAEEQLTIEGMLFDFSELDTINKKNLSPSKQKRATQTKRSQNTAHNNQIALAIT
jgi:3'-phosphoadenosine 5'-phosphosulfate sulfotransferase (PAPS reductase)/FAD synthetase